MTVQFPFYLFANRTGKFVASYPFSTLFVRCPLAAGVIGRSRSRGHMEDRHGRLGTSHTRLAAGVIRNRERNRKAQGLGSVAQGEPRGAYAGKKLRDDDSAPRTARWRRPQGASRRGSDNGRRAGRSDSLQGFRRGAGFAPRGIARTW